MSGASEKAIEAARTRLVNSGGYDDDNGPAFWGRDADAVLEAAHDPSLGLDRSVCLRDVVEMANAYDLDMMRDFVEWLEEKFTT